MIGKFEFVRRHKNCKYNGKIMKCSRFLPNGKEEVWLWCHGKEWVKKENDVESSVCFWKFCGYSTRKEDDTDKFVESLIGMDESEAKGKIAEKDLCCRIRQRDGEDFIGTADFRTDRINFWVKDGKVIKAYVG
jgi:hypothetical protein